MKLSQINSRLQEILANMGVNFMALTDQADFTRDLGLDSLDVTDLLVQVETTFSIRIPDEDWWNLKPLGQLREYLTHEVMFD
ncbi:acyl carrier protein [Spirosoma sp. RP8]|uniref:Acyl carrier protein n=1 Tax=Spirosoma liriopis TaxID=2937440 RepID=A0ABT0HQL7_9BACT|nr:acyl carrier protein [Spirosoma liriopis]MCK8494459.1 acyl carrier protein [Spirosoma liriopis]